LWTHNLTNTLLNHTDLQSEYVMAVEWEKTQLQELDISATDLSTECLTDLLTRLTSLRWLSAGQQDGLNDSVCLRIPYLRHRNQQLLHNPIWQ